MEEIQPVEIEVPEEFDRKVLKGFFDIVAYFYIFAAVFALIGVVLNFMSARYLGQRRNKVFSMITAGVNCIAIPLGTALGVFTLVVLSRTSVETSYRRKEGS